MCGVLFRFTCAPPGSTVPPRSTPVRWIAFLGFFSWVIPITGLPGLLEESSCLPWP